MASPFPLAVLTVLTQPTDVWAAGFSHTEKKYWAFIFLVVRQLGRCRLLSQDNGIFPLFMQTSSRSRIFTQYSVVFLSVTHCVIKNIHGSINWTVQVPRYSKYIGMFFFWNVSNSFFLKSNLFWKVPDYLYLKKYL